MISSANTHSFDENDYSRQELLKHQVNVFKSAQNTRADVVLIDINGRKRIYKDYTNSSKGFSLLLAPFLVYRETKALQRLQSVANIPSLVAKVSSRSFLMEYIPAQRIRVVESDLDWPKFIGNTENLIRQLHNNGVVHGDLRNATNILVDETHNPVFVDLASAVHRGKRYNPLSWALFRLCLRIDRGALYKLKKKYAPNLISDNERLANEYMGKFEIVMRWISVRIRNVIQKLFP